jgi:hypothetical protein
MLKAYYFDRTFEFSPCLILSYDFRTKRCKILKFVKPDVVVTRECHMGNLAILKGWNKYGLPEGF